MPEQDSGISQSRGNTREKENFRYRDLTPFSPPEKTSTAPSPVTAEMSSTFQAISSRGNQDQLSPEDGDMGLYEKVNILAHTSSMTKESPAEKIELKAMAPIPPQPQLSTNSQNVTYQSGTVSYPYPTVQARVEVSHQVARPPEEEEQVTTSFFSSKNDKDKNQQPHTALTSTQTPPDMLQVSAKLVPKNRVCTVHMPMYFKLIVCVSIYPVSSLTGHYVNCIHLNTAY